LASSRPSSSPEKIEWFPKIIIIRNRNFNLFAKPGSISYLSADWKKGKTLGKAEFCFFMSN